MSTVVTIPTIVRVVGVGVQGLKGDIGPAGGSALDLLAGATLSGHRLVSKQADGSVVYVGNNVLADMNKPFWLTLSAASIGTSVTVQSGGVVDEPSWTWTPGPLYLGTLGQLTQTVPVSPAVFLVQVGYATSPTSIVLDRQPSIHLI